VVLAVCQGHYLTLQALRSSSAANRYHCAMTTSHRWSGHAF
jgi:hypothetical protein